MQYASGDAQLIAEYGGIIMAVIEEVDGLLASVEEYSVRDASGAITFPSKDGWWEFLISYNNLQVVAAIALEKSAHGRNNPFEPRAALVHTTVESLFEPYYGPGNAPPEDVWIDFGQIRLSRARLDALISRNEQREGDAQDHQRRWRGLSSSEKKKALLGLAQSTTSKSALSRLASQELTGATAQGVSKWIERAEKADRNFRIALASSLRSACGIRQVSESETQKTTGS